MLFTSRIFRAVFDIWQPAVVLYLWRKKNVLSDVLIFACHMIPLVFLLEFYRTFLNLTFDYKLAYFAGVIHSSSFF